ncbi:MAG TPA: universal stress protein [Cyclobacteriaceae bacterium]|nr:universal stress protein [Cyclobacteriaceae bacterium]
MLNRLIVLIDFSEATHSIIALAAKWSNLLQAEVLLLHQVPGLAPVLTEQEVKNQIIENEIKEAQDKLKHLAEDAFADDTIFYTQASAKNLTESLSALVEKSHRNLILLGLKETGLMKKIFFGSVATKIIEDVNNTCVAVPAHASNLEPESLSIAVHHKFPLNQTALNQLLEIFSGCIKEIEFISLIKSPDEEAETKQYLKQLAEEYHKKIQTSYHLFKGADVGAELKNYMQHKPKSILVLQKGTRKLNDNLLRRFTVHDLVHDGSMPLIIMP